jgi:cytochrome c oxidase subunit 2
MLGKTFNNLLNRYTYDLAPARNIHDIYGFSEPASHKMEILIEMYHNTVVTLSIILGAIMLLIGIITYWYRSSKNLYPIRFLKSAEYLVDALFVFVPIIIVYYLAVPAVGFIINNDKLLSYVDTPFSLEITGHQWYWSYVIHALENNAFFSLFFIIPDSNSESLLHSGITDLKVEFDQVLNLESKTAVRLFEVNKHVVLPAEQLIKCEVSSDDVIHSWALPQLGIKVDAIPGRVQSFVMKSERCGIFYGQCSELCGVNHGFMPIVVEFVEMEAFYDFLVKELNYRPYKVILAIIKESGLLKLD